jgi:hypothetical protein
MIDEQLYSEDSPLYQALKKLVKEAVREVLAERGWNPYYTPFTDPWYTVVLRSKGEFSDEK